MSRSHIYESVEMYDFDGSPIFVGKMIKSEYAAKWRELLTTEEKAKYDSLSNIEQLQVAMSCNPFRSLGAEE